MNSVAYLLPPEQRTLARFMNLYNVGRGSEKILKNHTGLTLKEWNSFSLIPRYAARIEE